MNSNVKQPTGTGTGFLKVLQVGTALNVKRFCKFELHKDALWMQPHEALSCPFESRKDQSLSTVHAKVDYREDYITLKKSHLCEFKTLN